MPLPQQSFSMRSQQKKVGTVTAQKVAHILAENTDPGKITTVPDPQTKQLNEAFLPSIHHRKDDTNLAWK